MYKCNQMQKSNQLECKRAAPRFKTNFTAKVESALFCIPATITNLSTSGLQLECELQSLQVIMPNINRPNPHRPIQFHIRFQVPTQLTAHANIDLICSLIYARRISQQKAVVGCEFVSFEQDSEEKLLNYINHFAIQI